MRTATMFRSDGAVAATPTAKPPEVKTAARRRAIGSGWLGAIGLVVVLLAWQVSAWVGLANPSFTSSPIGALKALAGMIGDGSIWHPTLQTLESVFLGMLITVVVGIPLGLIIGRSRVLDGLTELVISIMYSVPFVVFLPIIISWFGIGSTARLMIVLWSAIFPLMINVIAGARNVDQNYLNVAKVFCASRGRTLGAVALPATMPYILAGVRQAVGRALVGAIVAELFMGSSGLGYVVQLQTSNFQLDKAMAAIVVIALIAVALTRAVAAVERRFTFWSASV